MCDEFEMNDDTICDLEFLIAKLIGDINEEQALKLIKLREEPKED